MPSLRNKSVPNSGKVVTKDMSKLQKRAKANVSYRIDSESDSESYESSTSDYETDSSYMSDTNGNEAKVKRKPKRVGWDKDSPFHVRRIVKVIKTKLKLRKRSTNKATNVDLESDSDSQRSRETNSTDRKENGTDHESEVSGLKTPLRSRKYNSNGRRQSEIQDEVSSSEDEIERRHEDKSNSRLVRSRILRKKTARSSQTSATSKENPRKRCYSQISYADIDTDISNSDHEIDPKTPSEEIRPAECLKLSTPSPKISPITNCFKSLDKYSERMMNDTNDRTLRTRTNSRRKALRRKTDRVQEHVSYRESESESDVESEATDVEGEANSYRRINRSDRVTKRSKMTRTHSSARGSKSKSADDQHAKRKSPTTERRLRITVDHSEQRGGSVRGRQTRINATSTTSLPLLRNRVQESVTYRDSNSESSDSHESESKDSNQSNYETDSNQSSYETDSSDHYQPDGWSNSEKFGFKSISAHDKFIVGRASSAPTIRIARETGPHSYRHTRKVLPKRSRSKSSQRERPGDSDCEASSSYSEPKRSRIKRRVDRLNYRFENDITLIKCSVEIERLPEFPRTTYNCHLCRFNAISSSSLKLHLEKRHQVIALHRRGKKSQSRKISLPSVVRNSYENYQNLKTRSRTQTIQSDSENDPNTTETVTNFEPSRRSSSLRNARSRLNASPGRLATHKLLPKIVISRIEVANSEEAPTIGVQIEPTSTRQRSARAVPSPKGSNSSLKRSTRAVHSPEGSKSAVKRSTRAVPLPEGSKSALKRSTRAAPSPEGSKSALRRSTRAVPSPERWNSALKRSTQAFPLPKGSNSARVTTTKRTASSLTTPMLSSKRTTRTSNPENTNMISGKTVETGQKTSTLTKIRDSRLRKATSILNRSKALSVKRPSTKLKRNLPILKLSLLPPDTRRSGKGDNPSPKNENPRPKRNNPIRKPNLEIPKGTAGIKQVKTANSKLRSASSKTAIQILEQMKSRKNHV